MKIFWFEFHEHNEKKLPLGTRRGCGVTAHDKEDAIKLLKYFIFKDWEVLPINSIKENISLEELEQNHVAPNIGNIMERGLWYPNFGLPPG